MDVARHVRDVVGMASGRFPRSSHTHRFLRLTVLEDERNALSSCNKGLRHLSCGGIVAAIYRSCGNWPAAWVPSFDGRPFIWWAGDEGDVRGGGCFALEKWVTTACEGVPQVLAEFERPLFLFHPSRWVDFAQAIMERTPFPPGLVWPSWNVLKLANSFRKRRSRYKWRTSGVGESRVTLLEDFVGIIVPEDSSRLDMHEYQLLDGVDHFDVCRPHNRMSDSFLALTRFIGTLLDDLQEEEESSGGRRDFTKAEENGDMNAFRWYEDPLTWDKMCDPVKCSDGRTYDRWTILDKKMSRSPYNRNLTTFGILCDDIDARSRLFRVFPEQELEFRERRKMYREEALQHTRVDPIEFEDAQEKLSNVVKWMPLDHDCQTELDAIQFLVSHLPKSKVFSRSPPPPEQSHISRTPVTIREIRDSAIPVLTHEDVIRARTNNIEGYRLVVFLVFFYMLFWFFIT